ncbi:MAG: ketoacyl-ACP synthase III [Bacteroidota bacterium]|jgi:3-oxoacyl-[acyl-carrier-protein] synthase-3
MQHLIHSIFTATGSYIPKKIVKNEEFLYRNFYNSNKEKILKPNQEIVAKFEEITGISERRYITDNLVTSDIAYLSALDALNSSGFDKESIDYIIVAHNFGDVKSDNRRSDFVPSLAARVKHRLGILNPKTVAYDIAFGCPGWLQAVIQADYYIKSGDAKRVLVIGAEALSRISDPNDIDSMIYSDGAGAVILEARESEEPVGILSHVSRSDTMEFSKLLWMDSSYNPEFSENDLFLKMLGHKLYKYALQTVPGAIKECLEKVKLTLEDIKKVLIHQANGKMDEEILNRIFNLYGVTEGLTEKVKAIMPMTISWLGNSSVATLPTLFDLMLKGKIENHIANSGDTFVFASVGAGMNVNCLVYKMP